MKRAPRNSPADRRSIVEATIDELAPGGDGVAIVPLVASGGAEAERRAVFVRGATVGDRVRLAVDARARPARGEIVQLLTAGPDRVAPPCAYADRCGGCDWMHVAAPAQRRAHEAHVRGALPPAFRGVPIVAHDAPSPLRYRTRARVHVRASGGRAVVGMNEARSHEPVEVETCEVLDADLEQVRRQLGPLLEGAHGFGEAHLALGPLDGSPRRGVVDLRWSGRLPPAVFARAERAVHDGLLAGLQLTSGEAARPAKIGDPTPWMRGADGLPLRLPVGGFAQASDEGNARLARRVAELAATTAPTPGAPLRIVELFAGAGNLTVLLAPLAEGLVAVESSRDACDAARENLAARAATRPAGAKPPRVLEADASAYDLSPATQLVVLDPPRTGARAVAERLVTSKVKHVLYVSCDPQTLGRDLRILEPRFTARAIETFEMFPQTSHVETVVLLERAKAP